MQRRTDWKTFTKNILNPPAWSIPLLTALATVALMTVFVKDWNNTPIAYAVYVLSFYALLVVCVFVAVRSPLWYRKIKTSLYSTTFGRRYMTDAVFKTHVSLYRSLTLNLLYVLSNVISGIVYASAWFYVLAGYYSILAVMRFLLLRFVHRIGIGNSLYLEFRRSRLCGIILMFINLTLTATILMVLYSGRGFRYNGVMIYPVAMYTFYITTHSVIQLVKYRRYNSPVLLATKIIGLSAALVSMLSLETAMLAQFAVDMQTEKRNLIIALTGAGVSVAVIAMAVYMIAYATVQIAGMCKRKESHNDQVGA